ncbi:MAG TPA: hypothetical protein VN641_07680 [Urbifossiella sp.]|nr:hypothetical protein [Urbifossiella sp.]
MNHDPDELPIYGARLFCARLLACGHIEADLMNPDDGYSLRNVLVHVRPSDGLAFPFRVSKLFLFAQLFGAADDYLLRVRMTRIDEDNEEFGESVDFGPWEISLPDDGNYVECFGFPLAKVPFEESGVYEFQLWADGIENMLYNERVEARNRR